MVDEDARQLVADRLVDEERGDRGIHASGERTENAFAPDLRPDALDLLLDHGCRRPGRRGVRDRVEEVLQQIVPVGRVHDLGVELHSVEPPLGILEGGDRRGLRGGDDARSGRRSSHRVAVAHPADLLRREIDEELALLGLELRLPELRDAGALDLAAQILGHELHPVADAECGDPELEDPRVDLRRAFGVDRRRPTREDERERVPRVNGLGRDGVGHELRVHATFPNAPCDQLRVLAAEVQNEHRPLFGGRLRRGQWDDVAQPMPTFWACWRALPSV